MRSSSNKKMSIIFSWTFLTIIISSISLVSSSSSLHNEDGTAKNLNGDLIQFVEDFMENEFLSQGKAVGLGLSITLNNETYSTGLGYRDREKELRADSNTKFPIGSISKVRCQIFEKSYDIIYQS